MSNWNKELLLTSQKRPWEGSFGGRSKLSLGHAKFEMLIRHLREDESGI